MFDYRKQIRKILGVTDPKELSRHVFAINAYNTTHELDRDACALSEQFIRHCGFSPELLKPWLEEKGYFTFEHDYSFFKKKTQDGSWKSVSRGYCKMSRPTNKLANLVAEVHRRMRGEKKIKMCRNTRYGLEVKSIHNIVRRESVKIDRDALIELKQSLDARTDIEEKKKPAIRDACDYYLTVTEDGYIHEMYYQNKSGRYTAIGNSLQNAPSVVRKAMLKGYWSYDFAVSQPSILNQIWSHNQLNEYVNNKNDIRKRVSKETGLSIKDVKMVIQAVQYSASIEGDKGSALERKLEDRVNRLKQSPWLVRWKDTHIKAADEVIRLPEYRVWYSHITNKSKRLAYILQHIEVQMLEAIMDKYPIKALLHDGFVSKNRLPVEEMQQEVLDKTGFHVTIEETKL